MPRFEFRDPFGYSHICETSEPETAARWLLEFGKLAATADVRFGPWTLMVWVLYPDGKSPDWPVNGAKTREQWVVQNEQMQKLADLLDEHLQKA